MSNDEVMDIDSIPSSSKGKGKASSNEFPPHELNENLPWVEKYRPVTLDDVVSHKDITSTIEKFIEKNRLPHLLFYGPPGTGKTSTILAVARRIYGEEYRKQILELNASDDRGIDVVREQIKQFAETLHQECPILYYLFSPLPSSEVEKRINLVIETEKVKVTDDGKKALMKLSKGDMRRALNVLQACHAAYDITSETEIYNCTGSPHPSDIETIVKSMLSDEFTTAHQLISTMKTERGLALQDLLVGVYEYIETIEIKPHARIYLLDHLATTEYRLSTGGSEKIQMSALLGAFKNAVELTSR
ncbi:dna replication factor [Lentinula edodes]|uniref:Replication factor C subunit 3 n=1 Tax=Lentinula edodes TaxID=5353 RepID=A0A1Q3DZY6_LENED|nr:dna replication factor [Lentinula edodes]